MENNNDNGLSPVYREFHEVPDDEVLSTNSYDNFMPTYRSAGVMTAQPINTLNYASTQNAGNMLQKPTLQRENVKQNNAIIISSENKSNSKLKASELPDILMATHFSVRQNLDAITSLVSGILKDTNGASYQFDETKCEVCNIYS